MGTTRTAEKSDQKKSPTPTRRTYREPMSGGKKPEHLSDSSPPFHRYLGNSYIQSIAIAGSELQEESGLPPIVREVLRSPGRALDLSIPAPQTGIEPAEFAFSFDTRKRTWRRYARSEGRKDAARIRKSGKLSFEDRKKVNARLGFFEGQAKEAYIREIKPALLDIEAQEQAKLREKEATAAYYSATRQSVLDRVAKEQAERREREGMLAYYTSTRQAVLDRMESELHEEISGISLQQIDSQWKARKHALISVASSPNHRLDRQQLLRIYTLYWADRNEVARAIYGQIQYLEPKDRMAAEEAATNEDNLTGQMIRTSVSVNEFLIAAESRGKHYTLPQLNEKAIKLAAFHESLVSATGMIVPGGLRLVPFRGRVTATKSRTSVTPPSSAAPTLPAPLPAKAGTTAIRPMPVKPSPSAAPGFSRMKRWFFSKYLNAAIRGVDLSPVHPGIGAGGASGANRPTPVATAKPAPTTVPPTPAPPSPTPVRLRPEITAHNHGGKKPPPPPQQRSSGLPSGKPLPQPAQRSPDPLQVSSSQKAGSPVRPLDRGKALDHHLSMDEGRVRSAEGKRIIRVSPELYDTAWTRATENTGQAGKSPRYGFEDEVRSQIVLPAQRPDFLDPGGRLRRGTATPRHYHAREFFGETTKLGQEEARYFAEANLRPDGIVDLDFRLRVQGTSGVRRSSRLRGEQEFKGALAHFRRHNGKDSVKGIRGDWNEGDNLARFNERFNQHLTDNVSWDEAFRQAALETRTGGWAKAAGYTEVKRETDQFNPYTMQFDQVVVVFEKGTGSSAPSSTAASRGGQPPPAMRRNPTPTPEGEFPVDLHRKTPQHTPTKADQAVQDKAKNRLLQALAVHVKKGGGMIPVIEVEGVRLHEVKVALHGTECRVGYFGIENVSGPGGYGLLVHQALEQAAIDAAVKAGARSARVMVETVVNSRWQNRLEALGYTKFVIPRSGEEFGFQAVMSRVFPVSQR